MIARLAVAVAALALAVVLAADLRETRSVAHAVTAAPQDLPASLATLRAAAGGTEDTAPLLRRAELLLSAQRYEEALADARAAARREPENAQAWLLAGLAAGGLGDAAAEADARRRINALVARP